MKKLLLYWCLMLLSGIFFSCGSRIESTAVDDEKTEKAEEAARLDYYGPDTLLINEYTSESGHRIRLEGSKSGDVYRIKLQSKQGKQKTIQVAEDWYSAAHSAIVWDNDNYLGLYYGCGTECWGIKIISLNDDRETMNYPADIYTDSVLNLVVYPDYEEPFELVFENFTTRQQIRQSLALCSQILNPIMAIDTIFKTNIHTFAFTYKASDCTPENKEIDISSLLETDK